MEIYLEKTSEKYDALIKRMRTVITKRIETAIEKIRTRYEQNADITKNLDFHNARHTESVMRRTETILLAIQKISPHLVSDKDILLGQLSAALHDEEQFPDTYSGLFGERLNATQGRNEEESTRSALRFISEHSEIFTESDKETVSNAILSTEVMFDITHATVRAKTAPKNIVAAALMLADTGTAGTDGGSAFIEDGDALFRERFPNIFNRSDRITTFSEEEQTAIREKILDWSAKQISFAKGRQALFEKELSFFPEDTRPAVRKLFNRFEESIHAAQEKYAKRQNMKFEDLMIDMRFKPHHEILH